MALTRLPYRDQDDEQDPYRRESPDGAIVEPYQESEPVRTPEPEKATEPSRVEEQKAPIQQDAPAAPAPTFKQLQDAGQARPPMPANMLPGGSGLLQRTMGAGPEPIEPDTGLPPTKQKLPQLPPAIVEPEVPVAPPIPQPLPPMIEELPPSIGVGDGDGQAPDGIIEPEEQFPAILPPSVPPGAIIEQNEPTPAVVDGGEGPGSSIDLLQMLLNGTQDTELEDATESAALDQLHNPSPYNSDVVKNLYADLGAGIDTDYDSRVRGLDESMARRGLYGSLGKDFHSGRLADTELGRRDAKTTLARNLATDFAKSYGDYNANAISQGQGVAGSQSSDALNWLQSTLGYGQQGFENDLATEQLNAQQDDEYQQLLQMMLAAGYGA